MVGALDVVMVTTSYPRHEGDFAGHFVASLATELAALGDHVTVIAPHASGLEPAEEIRGVSVRRVRYAPDPAERIAYGDGIVPNLRRDPVSVLRIPGFARALSSAVREYAPSADVVHVHWAPTAVLAGVAQCGAPVVLSLHGSDVTLADRGVLLRSLLRRGLAAADAAIVVAQAQREMIVGGQLVGGRLTGGSIDVIPSGIPLELTHRRRHTESRGSQEGLGPRFLFVGRLVESKGVLELLEAFAAVAELLPDATLTFAGKGPLQGRLSQRADAHGLTSGVEPRVELLGAVSHERALELMGAADALVLPSHGEGSPLVVTEALALGTPVIGTPVGAVPTLVSEAGIIVPVGDPVALADALEAFGQRRETYARLGLEARDRMAAQYGWPAITRRVRAVYHEAIERRGSVR